MYTETKRRRLMPVALLAAAFSSFAMIASANAQVLEGGQGAGGAQGAQVEQLSTIQVGDNVRTPAQAPQVVAEELWTTAELQAAQPYPMPMVSEEAQIERLMLTEPSELQALREILQAEGQQLTVQPGGRPEDEEAPSEEAPAATTGGYTYPPPYTRYEIFDPYTTWPRVTVGKLFFRQQGTGYVCSAASIGNYAIWTAGHCVHSGNGSPNGWSTDVVFVPAYKDGNAPHGQWRASWLATKTVWYQNGIPDGLTGDMGIAVLQANASGRKISQVVGWLGFAWNWSRIQHWNDFGYPAASPFNGQRLIVCQASAAYNGSVSGVPPVGIGCDMTGGSSGGPWVWRFGTGNYLNGNNSYRRSNRPEEMYSPYFDDRAKSLFDLAVGGTP